MLGTPALESQFSLSLPKIMFCSHTCKNYRRVVYNTQSYSDFSSASSEQLAGRRVEASRSVTGRQPRAQFLHIIERPREFKRWLTLPKPGRSEVEVPLNHRCQSRSRSFRNERATNFHCPPCLKRNRSVETLRDN